VSAQPTALYKYGIFASIYKGKSIIKTPAIAGGGTEGFSLDFATSDKSELATRKITLTAYIII